MTKNSINKLRTIEQYFTVLLYEITGDNSKILSIKDNVFKQKVLLEFIHNKISELQKQIKTKTN